jgi:cytochrome c551/c552
MVLCLICAGVEVQMGGPSYKEVAQGDRGAVIGGGAGVQAWQW